MASACTLFINYAGSLPSYVILNLRNPIVNNYLNIYLSLMMRESPPVTLGQMVVSRPPGQQEDEAVEEVAPGLERPQEEAQHSVLTPEVEGGQQTEGRHDEEEDGGEGTPPSLHSIPVVPVTKLKYFCINTEIFL